MNIIGQFVEAKLSFNNKDIITGQKIVWVHAMSGHKFMKGDGVLGLGVEYEEKNEEDGSSGKSDDDDDDGTYDDSDDDDDGQPKRNNNNNGNSGKDDSSSSQKFESYELNTGIVSNHISQIERITQ